MKLIREGRFGRSKQFKTGAIVGSYPKPLLYAAFDNGGLDVLPSKGGSVNKEYLPLDSTIEDVKWVTIEELTVMSKLKREELPRITAVDFFSNRSQVMSESYKPMAQASGLVNYVKFCNVLEAVKDNCPWATNVVDPITGYTETVHMHIAQANVKAMEDARKWAPDIGYQVLKTIGALSRVNAHAVFIFHSTIDKNELTSEISELPMVPSNYARDRVGGMLQQFFYATKENGKPIIYTSDRGIVRGIGARFPSNLPNPCGPLYQDIYERK